MELNQDLPVRPKNQYWSRREQGLCVRCGDERDDSSSITMCSGCRLKSRERGQAHLHRTVSRGVCPKCHEERELRKGSLCEDCRFEKHITSRQRGLLLKEEVLAAYGGPVCVCCGETCIGFLTLDHVNNDGTQHRRSFNPGENQYTFLRRNNYPQDVPLQVMCYNCNLGRAKNGGMCPHHGYNPVSNVEFN